MIKGVTHAHLGPVWYHSEPSDVSYSPNQFLGWDFFTASYSKMALQTWYYLIGVFSNSRKTIYVKAYYNNLMSLNLVEECLG